MEMPPNTAGVRGATFGVRNAAPYAIAMLAVTALSFLSGGYILGRSTPIVVAVLAASAVWMWLVRRDSRAPGLLVAALVALAAFSAWAGLSVLWSLGPDLTWVSFNLTAFYFALFAVLCLTPVRRLQLALVGWGWLAVAAAVAVYSYLGKAAPTVVTHAHTYARLESPIGYWNVLALMMVMGLVVAVAFAGDRRTHVSLRVLAAAAAVPMCVTFFFTFSRGGWIALAVVLALYFAFTTTRLSSAFSLAAIVAPVALVLWRVRGLETLFSETTNDVLRALQGGVLLRWSLAALLLTAGVQLAGGLVQEAVRWPRWSSLVAGTAVVVLVAGTVVGGSARLVQQRGGTTWVKDRLHALATDSGGSGAGNTAARLVSLRTGRPELWREALDQSRYDRVSGTGAGTFRFTHYRFRRPGGGIVKHAHSQWFNVLAELGVVGLALFVACVALLLAVAIGNPFSRRRDPLFPLLVALQAGVVAFFVHVSWDWDWDMAAVGTLAFVFIAACASYRATRGADERRAAANAATADETARAAKADEEAATRAEAEPAAAAEPGGPDEPRAGDATAAPGAPPARPVPERPVRRRYGWGWRVVASAALVVLAVSWLPPYLSGRAHNAALTAASDGHVTLALTHARRAARLDPLAVDPLLTEARLLEQLGRARDALARLQAAAKLQPDDFEVWYHLGVLEHGTLGHDKAARAALTRALALNPGDGPSRFELQLVTR